MLRDTCTFDAVPIGATFYLAVMPEDLPVGGPPMWCQYVKMSGTLILGTAGAGARRVHLFAPEPERFTYITPEVGECLECRLRLPLDHGPDQPAYVPGRYYVVQRFRSVPIGCVFSFRGVSYAKRSTRRALIIGWEVEEQPGRPVAVPFEDLEYVRVRGVEDRLPGAPTGPR